MTTIILPNHLNLLLLKAACLEHGFPVVPRNRDDLSMVPTFCPTEPLRFDARSLSSGTGEALCCLAALVEWLRKEDGGNVSAFGGEHLRSIGFLPDLSTLEVPTFSQSAAEIALPPFRHSLPSGSSLEPTVLDSLCALVDSVTDGIAAVMPSNLDATPVHRPMAAFLFETLLNVHEHAAPDSPTAAAWIAATILTAGRLASTHAHLPRHPVIADWLAAQARRGATLFVELAVVDNGIGVPVSLAPALLRRQPHLRESLDGTFREGYWRLHDETLRYAFSPYGTRKSETDFAVPHLSTAWRGLYKVRHRALAGSSLLTIRSGYASRAYYRRDAGAYDDPVHDERLDRTPWPWTSLVLMVALPWEGIGQAAEAEFPQAEPIDLQSLHFVPASARPDAIGVFASHMTDPRDYLVHVERTVAADHLRSSAVAPGPFCGVAHPAIAVPHLPPSPHASRHRSVDSVLQEDNQAQALLALLTQHSYPGHIPIHLGLDLQPHLVSRVRKMLSTLAREQQQQPHSRYLDRPCLAGLVLPGEEEIHWFLSHSGHDVETELASTGNATCDLDPTGHVEDLAFDLARLYPTFVQVNHRAEGRIELRLLLPHRVSQTTIATTLTGVLPQLAQTPRDMSQRWFWSASRGMDEYMVTSSGHAVSQYVSLYALCETEPVVEKFFRQLLLAQVDSLRQPGVSVVVVPTHHHSAYIVAKRLLLGAGPAGDLLVAASLDLRHFADSRYRILLFSDILYTGYHLTQRRADASVLSLSLVPVTCIDARPLDSGQEHVTTFCRWPFPPPRDRSATVTYEGRVDPVTHEVLSAEAIEDAAQYASLRYHESHSPAPRGDAWPASLVFHHGLQRFGGRVHCIRCPTHPLFSDADLLLEALRPLFEAVFRKAGEGADDVVLFIREEAHLWKYRHAIGTAARALQRDLSPNWGGRFLVAPVFTARLGDRQVVRHSLSTALAHALPVGSEHPGPAQPSLFAEIDGLNDAPISSRYHAVYLDNAAVSGRTIRDFVRSLADVSSATSEAVSVHLFPIIDRLSPGEAAFYRRVSELGAIRPGRSSIRLSFHSFAQLRVRSFADVESTPVYRAVQTILGALSDVPYEPVLTWAQSIESKFSQLASSESFSPDICPLSPRSPSSREHSVETAAPNDVVLLRHLLSVLQQGVPLLEEYLTLFAHLAARSEPALLTMFALEPDLVDDQRVGRLFGDDLVRVCRTVLDSSASAELRTNALFVWWLVAPGYGDHAAHVAVSCAGHDILEAPWLALLLATPDSDSRDGALSASMTALDEHGTQDLASLRAVLRAETATRKLLLPRTDDEAYAALYRLLEEGRREHGYRGSGAWWRLDSICTAMARDPSYSPDSASLPEPLWEEFASFVSRVVAPSAAAVLRLSAQHGLLHNTSIARYCRTLELVAAQVAEAGRRLLVEPGIARSRFVERFRHLQRLTLEKSTEHLLGRRATCLLLSATPDSVGLIDYWLPAIVTEPVALLLQTLINREASPTQITLSLDGDTRSTATGFARDLLENLVLPRWENAGQMTVVRSSPAALVECYALLVDNILAHADLTRPVSIYFLLERSRAVLRVSDLRRSEDQPGDGRGHVQLAHVTQHRLGGHLLIDYGPPFHLEHEVQASSLSLTPLGVH